jgi:nucleotide-binding universal stress UspA family protein
MNAMPWQDQYRDKLRTPQEAVRAIKRGDHVFIGTVEAIIDTAEREDADLIAIASHGRSGLSQVFYGSVAAGVLHRVERPLLVIRSQDTE